MPDFTIVYGGSQAASNGYASGGVDVMLILGKGEPQGSLYPQVKAALGSEYVDCTAGFTYQKKTKTGQDADWVPFQEPPAAASVPAPVAAKRKRKARRKKQEASDA